MITTTLDSIVRRGLLETGHSIHFYAEHLFHASAGLRELSFDSLQIINSVNLPVSSYASVDMPDDFVDDVSVCIPAGQSLNALPKQDWITPIRIHDSTGAYIPYSTLNDTDEGEAETIFGFPASWTWFNNFDDYGSPTGGFYGANGGTQAGYKVIRERRQIQMTENFIGSNVVLLYISDGQSINAASQIDPQAFAAIRAYTEWKRSRNANNEQSPEGSAWYNQRRILRARLNPMTKTDLLNIVRNASKASIKG